MTPTLVAEPEMATSVRLASSASPRHADHSGRSPLEGPYRERRAASVQRHPDTIGHLRGKRRRISPSQTWFPLERRRCQLPLPPTKTQLQRWTDPFEAEINF